MKRLFIVLIVVLSLLYAGDCFFLRYRVSKNQDPFGTLQVERLYAIPQKDGGTEFMPGDPETEECVHSLFPHFGDKPCWYGERKKEERVNL